MTSSLQNFNWNKSKRGLCIRLWHHNVKNSIKRGHKPPEYTQKELMNWILNHENFNNLYTNWVNSNYSRDLSVSIDRLDDSIGYSFSNIQLITFKENYLKAHQGFRDKTLFNPTLLNGGHLNVYQYNKDGTFKSEFISLSEAARSIGVRHQLISRAIKQYSYAYGYFWCTDNTKKEFLNKLPLMVTNIKNNLKFYPSKIFKINIVTKEVLQEYDSIKSAAAIEGLSDHVIRQTIKGAPTRANLPYTFIKERNE